MENQFWRTVVWIRSGSGKCVRTWCSTEHAQHSLAEKQNDRSHEDMKTSCFTAIWFPARSRAVRLMQVLSGSPPRLCVSEGGGWDRPLAEGLLSFAELFQMHQILKWGAGGYSFTMKIAINPWTWQLLLKSWFNHTMIIYGFRLWGFFFPFFFSLH